MTPEYKDDKEKFVSFLGGGPIWEINHVALVAPAAAFLWAMLQTRQRFFTPYTLPAAFTDFLIQCAAILFATTIYSSAPQVLNGLLILPAIAAFLQPSSEAKSAAKPPAKAGADGNTPESNAASGKDEKDLLPIKPFITTYRGAMMIITCSSILAVDFPVFPRRFAKTESFGTSLMDIGVGSFMFAAGTVAARQQLIEQHRKASSMVKRFRNALRHSLPLIILGLARLWSVKSLEYAEHVSEYGVHWNFFFTMAAVPLVIAVLQPVLRLMPSYNIFAFVLAIGYELILYMVPDMKRWIILSERKHGDWLSQNREGVFSLIGYTAIFISGMGIGLNILPRDPDPQDPSSLPEKDHMDEDADWLASVLGDGNSAPEEPQNFEVPQLKPEFPKSTLPRLAFWTFLWFVFSVWAMWRYGPRLFVSRRMANLAYVCWVCAFNCAQLLLFCIIETVMFPHIYRAKDKASERQRAKDATSRVMSAFNRNGLAIFLIANLFTGLINIVVPTIYMDDVSSMAVLLAYMATICGIALTLDHFNLSIKL